MSDEYDESYSYFIEYGPHKYDVCPRAYTDTTPNIIGETWKNLKNTFEAQIEDDEARKKQLKKEKFRLLRLLIDSYDDSEHYHHFILQFFRAVENEKKCPHETVTYVTNGGAFNSFKLANHMLKKGYIICAESIPFIMSYTHNGSHELQIVNDANALRTFPSSFMLNMDEMLVGEGYSFVGRDAKKKMFKSCNDEIRIRLVCQVNCSQQHHNQAVFASNGIKIKIREWQTCKSINKMFSDE